MLLGGVLGGVGMTLAVLLLDQLPALSASKETADAAKTYLAINMVAMIPILLRIAVEQARMATGDSRSPMRVAIFANLINIGLDYFLIMVLGWGVAGAAYATVIANLIGSLAMFGIQALDGFELRSMRRHHVAAVWRIGVPTGLQFAMELGSYAVMVVMLTRLSELDGAANQIAIHVIHFGFLPCFAVSDAVSIMVGQAVGAHRRDLIKTLSRCALIPSIAYSGAATLVFAIGGRWLASGFTDDPALLELTTHLFWIAALFQIADAVNSVARGVLRGTGDVRYCAWTGIVLSWMMTPPFTWLLGYHYGLGAVGGWIGLLICILVSAIVFWHRLQRGRWNAAADRSLQELRS
jgi:MATE family multidrug resistance protein